MAKKSTIRDPRHETMIKILKEARIKLGLTQEELSLKMGQHRIFVNKVELGERRLDVVELNDICYELNLDIHDLINGTLKKISTKKSNKDYVVGFANGYLQGMGFKTDKDISEYMYKLKAEQNEKHE